MCRSGCFCTWQICSFICMNSILLNVTHLIIHVTHDGANHQRKQYTVYRFEKAFSESFFCGLSRNIATRFTLQSCFVQNPYPYRTLLCIRAGYQLDLACHNSIILLENQRQRRFPPWKWTFDQSRLYTIQLVLSD